MESDKGQSLILIGMGLILLSGICVYVSLSQSKVAEVSGTVSATIQTVSGSYYEEQTNTKNPGTNSTARSAKTTTKNNKTQTSQRSEAAAFSYPLNLNTATVEQLMTINGIGEARAAAILSYREHLGGYTSVEQIKNISGISDGVYNRIAPYLTV